MKWFVLGFFILVFPSLCLAEPQEIFRCGKHSLVMIRLGESRQHVLAACGMPDEIGKDFIAYNMGEQDFVYVLTFEYGRLALIDRTERGSGLPYWRVKQQAEISQPEPMPVPENAPPPEQPGAIPGQVSFQCWKDVPDVVRTGDSEQHVLQVCGEPDGRKGDVLYYNMGSDDFTYALTFDRHVLVSAQESGKGSGPPRIRANEISENQETGSAPVLKVVVSAEMREGPSVIVKGLVKNLGSSPAKDAYVKVEAISEDGTVVDESRAPTVPPMLSSGAEAKFSTTVKWSPNTKKYRFEPGFGEGQ